MEDNHHEQLAGFDPIWSGPNTPAHEIAEAEEELASLVRELELSTGGRACAVARGLLER